jgi:dual-specificity kinase
MSVFDFLKGNSFVPFPPGHVQAFAKQLLESVSCIFLFSIMLTIVLHSLDLVHTDLKPENILLVSNASFEVKCNQRGQRTKKILENTEIRLIDFGSATFNDEYHSNLVSTRHYRAPEIILGNIPFSQF